MDASLYGADFGYHSYCARVLTKVRNRIWDIASGQFDWGGRLLKSNGGAQFSSGWLETTRRVKAQGSLTARGTPRAGTKVGLKDPVVPSGRAIAQRIKATPGITG